MKKKVITNYIGSPHYYACCDDCNWKYENYRDHRKGQREIRKHVAETGHRVQLERLEVTEYFPEDEE